MGDRPSRRPWTPVLGAYGGRDHRRSGGIYPEHQFRDLILYEQARADRTGEHLSLVLCRLEVRKGRRGPMADLVHELLRSVRRTDHLGWFSRSEIGVLLPLTGGAGAQRYVANLQLDDLAESVQFLIHVYPDGWLENSKVDPYHRHDDSAEVFARPVPAWKRVLDVTGAGMGLMLLLPLLVLVSIYVKLVSPGPILYRQQRVGLARREFTFYKLRTMHHRNDESLHSHHARDFINFDTPMSKLDANDPRIIPGGRILRKLAIDELPQLINIIRGDMSLVGPRPCIPYEAKEYQQWHAHRFSILPGLTGLWQVSGKNKLTFQQMIRLDIAYENRMSFWFDLWIIIRTIPTVIGLGLEGVRDRLYGTEQPAYVRNPADGGTDP